MRFLICFCMILEQYPDSGEDISENMTRYAEKWGVNVPRRPQAGGVTLAPHFEAWGPYFPIWPRQSQDILIVLGKMWFSQWNLVFASTKMIFQCVPMFARALKHRFTFFNVYRCLQELSSQSLLKQTSVHIEKCKPMFAVSSQHQAWYQWIFGLMFV